MLTGVHIEQELPSAALQRASPLQHDNRAPESFAAVSKSISPSGFTQFEMLLGVTRQSRLAPNL